MLTGSVPISYCFRDKQEFQSNASNTCVRTNSQFHQSHLTSYCHHRCHRYLLMHFITINNNHCLAHQTLLSTGNSPISYGTLYTAHTSRNYGVRAANIVQLSPFSTSFAPSFCDTRDSLNFLSVHSSQNLPLISCMSP